MNRVSLIVSRFFRDYKMIVFFLLFTLPTNSRLSELPLILVSTVSDVARNFYHETQTFEQVFVVE